MRIINTVFLGVLCNLAFGQSSDSVQLKEVIISANRFEQDPFEVGRDVRIISREDIQNANYKSVGEVLLERAGINVIGVGQTPGSLQRMFMRGTNSAHTVIMIDGVRISDPSTVDNSIDLAELSLANVERIEVVNGTHSTMYGSAAIGGVINIITQKNQLNRINADVNLSYGNFGPGTAAMNNNYYMNFSDPSGFYVSTSANQQLVNGLDATVDTISSNVYNNPDKDNFNKIDLNLKTGYRKDKWDVFASLRRSFQSTDLDRSAFVDDDNRILTFKRNLFNYGINSQLSDKLQFRFIGGYSNMSRSDVNDSSVIDDNGNYDQSYLEGIYTGQQYNNELILAYDIDNIAFKMGLGHSINKMNNYSYTYINDPMWGLYESTYDLDSLNLSSTMMQGFLQGSINGTAFSKSLSGLNLVAGLRFNKHNQFGNHITYEINPSFALGDHSLLYASIATGFNAPALYRLYEPTTGFGAVTNRGNETLLPETSRNIEFGFKQRFVGKHQLSISVFNMEVSNVIEYVYLWNKNVDIDSVGPFDNVGDTYINLSKQKINGLNLGLNGVLSNKVKYNLNLTYINSTLTYDPADIDTVSTKGNHVQLQEHGVFLDEAGEIDGLIRRPKLITNLNLTYNPIDQLRIGLNLKYIDSKDDVYYDANSGPWGALARQKIESYFLADLLVSYAFNKRFDLGLKVENVLNQNYMEILGFNTRNRGIYLNAHYNFSR